MRSTITVLLITIFFSACNTGDKSPDVSAVKINTTTLRFEQDLFNTSMSLEQIKTKYPSFEKNFFNIILNADPKWGGDTLRMYVNDFTQAYKPIYDTANLVFKNFTPYENEIKKATQYLQHYFPKYKIPNKIITYVGPLDGYGDAISDDAYIIGLHHHLGANYSLYKTDIVRIHYPEYISARFAPEYIVVNCMKNVLDDMYPEAQTDKPLIDQMIDKGKRLYILSQLLPDKEDYRLIGYSKNQIEGCYQSEAAIWNLFTQNNLLQLTDKNIVKNYVGEGPKTQELGEDAPGNIGSFVGWQIVKKYMQKYPSTTLMQLMDISDETILQESKYKP